jgi:hypothetical protein
MVARGAVNIDHAPALKDGMTYRSHFFMRIVTLEMICVGFPTRV